MYLGPRYCPRQIEQKKAARPYYPFLEVIHLIFTYFLKLFLINFLLKKVTFLCNMVEIHVFYGCLLKMLHKYRIIYQDTLHTYVVYPEYIFVPCIFVQCILS